MIVLKITAIAFVCAVFSLALKKDQPAYGFLVSTAGAVCLLALCLQQVRPLLLWLKTLAAYTHSQNISIVLQAIGIALITQFAADLCRDAGISSAACIVELCGRALALIQALPLAQKLIDSFLSFLA